MATSEGGEVRVWQRPDGTLVIRDEDGRYGADVRWLDDMDQPPADAVPLLAAAGPDRDPDREDFVAANEALGEALTEIGMVLGLPKPRPGATWGAAEVLKIARAAREEISRLLATAGTEGEAELPRLRVDRQADAAYVDLTSDLTVDRTVPIGYGINVDLDDEGNVIGVELLSLTPRAAFPQGEAQGQGEPALAERVRSLAATWRALNDDLIEKSQARYRRSSGPSDAVAGRLQDRAQEVRRSARELEALLTEPAAASRAVAPVGNVDRETGDGHVCCKVSGGTCDPSYAFSARRLAEMVDELHEALGLPLDSMWADVLDRVRAAADPRAAFPVDADREALNAIQSVIDELRATGSTVRHSKVADCADRLVDALAALRDAGG